MPQYNPYTSFAKGGGCFLADTQIKTPSGTINIQDLKPGDKITSYNEVRQKTETSTFERLDILGAREYYEITTSKGSVKATGEHPFFIVGNDTDQHVIAHAKELEIGDYLVLGKDENVEIVSIHKHVEDVVVYNIINVSPNHNYFANNYLVHNKGGCFVDGTLISTPNGDVAIENLTVGDTILSLDVNDYTVEDAVIGDIDTFKTKGYYIVSTETQSVRVTGEHPFYVIEDGQTFVRTVEEIARIFNNTNKEQVVYNENDTFEKVVQVSFVDEVVRVHNLINVTPNHNYFANEILVHNKGGGGCFTGNTRITTPTGTKKIKNFRPGDTVVSYNEKNESYEYSKVASIQVLEASGYYVINDSIQVTATHPFYVDRGTKKYKVVEVADLKIGDELVTDAGTQRIQKIEFKDKPVTVYNLINVVPNHNYYANNYLVHNKGASSGSHASSSGAKGGSSSASVGKSTSSSTGKAGAKPTGSDASANKSNSKSTTSASTKPGSKVTTSDGKTVTTSTKVPAKSSQAGVAGVDGYTPKFKNGYTAPAGSVVYYPQHSALDYLPWIYLFSNHSPANDQATVVQPDGKQVTAPPTQDGADGLAILNWVLLFVIAAGIIGGIVWGVGKIFNKDKGSSYSDW